MDSVGRAELLRLTGPRCDKSISDVIAFVRKPVPKSIKPYLTKALLALLKRSIESAAKEQGLCELAHELEQIVPDIAEQYTCTKLETDYSRTKVRSQHAFQVSLIMSVIEEFANPVIVDIGDSSGTHFQYLLGLSNGKNIQTVSVNCDATAIEKIRRKGLKAICSRAEDLHNYDVQADVLVCLQTLEHLLNPCSFLHELSSKTDAKYLIVTVPYRKNSRIGLKHIREKVWDFISAERVHIFELSPDDWKLILRHSGWEVVRDTTYLQYPQKGFLRITSPLWKTFDFEGFYGLVLRRDDTWSSRYTDW